jgi:hypothetical protein
LQISQEYSKQLLYGNWGPSEAKVECKA